MPESETKSSVSSVTLDTGKKGDTGFVVKAYDEDIEKAKNKAIAVHNDLCQRLGVGTKI